MTATTLARRALGLKAQGTPTNAATRCVCCGSAIAKGELSEPMTDSSTFTNGRNLLHHHHSAEGPSRMCGDCVPFFSVGPMTALQKAIVTEDGAYYIGKKDYRAWFILYPPKTPFAVVFSDTQRQHLLWRTPVTLDPDHWLVQLGAQTLMMDRRRVIKAFEVCAKIGQAYLKETGKQLRSPFVGLDPTMAEMESGRIRAYVRRFAHEHGLSAEIDFLDTLSRGELWGLGPLLFTGGVGVQPEKLSASPKDEADNES